MRRMMMRRALVLLSVVLSLCGAHKRRPETWDHTDPAQSRTCSNLTQVLDNWKYAIMTQVKDLLVNDHASVLPEYVRIQPLSEALSELYRQFDSLKDELGKLTSKFDRVEAFVDDLQAGKLPPLPLARAAAPHRRPAQRLPARLPLRAPLRSPLRSNGTPRSMSSTNTRRRRVPRPYQ